MQIIKDENFFVEANSLSDTFDEDEESLIRENWSSQLSNILLIIFELKFAKICPPDKVL